MTHRDSFLASPCVPSPVSAIRTLKLPLLPLWEKGVGGMRGKGARECKTSLISPKNSTLESRGMKGQRVLRITLPITLEPAWHQSRTIPVITENHAHPGGAGVPNREPRTRNREPHAPWVRGRPRPHTRNPARPWVRGRLEPRTKNQEPRTENHMPPGCAGVSPACAQSCAYQECGRPEPRTRNQEPRTTCILGARASRPHARDPGAMSGARASRPHARNPARTRSAGVPNREPRTKNREPRASWVRGRPRPHTRNPARPWERGRPEPRTKNQEPRTTCILGARASRPHTRNPERPWVRGRPARMCKVLPLL